MKYFFLFTIKTHVFTHGLYLSDLKSVRLVHPGLIFQKMFLKYQSTAYYLTFFFFSPPMQYQFIPPHQVTPRFVGRSGGICGVLRFFFFFFFSTDESGKKLFRLRAVYLIPNDVPVSFSRSLTRINKSNISLCVNIKAYLYCFGFPRHHLNFSISHCPLLWTVSVFSPPYFSPSNITSIRTMLFFPVSGYLLFIYSFIHSLR